MKNAWHNQGYRYAHDHETGDLCKQESKLPRQAGEGPRSLLRLDAHVQSTTIICQWSEHLYDAMDSFDSLN